MRTRSVAVVVLDGEKRRVLLHKREDFRIWSLPGGRIEPGETWEGAAVRETYEETGYRVAVERLVGVYRRPQSPGGGDLTHVAAARVLDPDAPPDPFGWETVAVAWFPTDAPPRNLSRLGRASLADALVGHPAPVERTLHLPCYEAAALRLLLGLRGLRNRLLRRP